MTYAEAEKLFRTARNKEAGKPLANNTRLMMRGEDYAVKLHETDVITIHPDGTYTLNTGGWYTVTTKARINRFSPARIFQENGVWFVWDGSTRFPFMDGVKVDRNGLALNVEILPDAEDTLRVKRKLDRMVSEYINDFAEHVKANGLPEPSGGDCWGCHFRAQDHKPGEPYGGVMGWSHILLHMGTEDRYYVPSLVYNAIQSRGYGHPGFIWSRCTKGGDMLKDVLRSYFRKIKPQLLAIMTEGVAA